MPVIYLEFIGLGAFAACGLPLLSMKTFVELSLSVVGMG